MTLNSLLIILLKLLRYTAADTINDPIAYIGDNQIVGQRVWHSFLETNQYLGIPYAEAPVEKLRFMKPVPIKSNTKVFRADQQPPACHQYSEKPFPWYINSTEKSEDCLYLNIWTPTDASPQNTKAVMYWIHGGGFKYGSIRDPLYDGTALSAMGDIVVVAANYRLGPLGFITSDTKDSPGNAGLWDILEGLKWVNRNILAFGGDPTRITIAGESVGSISVGLLSISPLSRGLFCRQIMQSGSPAIPVFENKNNIALSQIVATKVKCANETFTIYEHPKEVTKCLKDKDAVTINKVEELLYTESTLSFSPQYGDAILPQNPVLTIQNAEFHGKDLLCGVNKDEGLLLSTNYDRIFGFFGQKNPHINKTTGKVMMRKIYASFPYSESILNYYLDDTIKETAYEAVRKALFTSFGDMILVCPTLFYAEKSAEMDNGVYVYYWVHRPSTTPWGIGDEVAHFSEVQFVFGRPILYPQLYQQEEVQTSLQMMVMWSNFVKNGNPGFSWPLYRKDSPVFKYLGPGGDTEHSGTGPHLQNCNFWRPQYGF